MPSIRQQHQTNHSVWLQWCGDAFRMSLIWIWPLFTVILIDQDILETLWPRHQCLWTPIERVQWWNHTAKCNHYHSLAGTKPRSQTNILGRRVRQTSSSSKFCRIVSSILPCNIITSDVWSLNKTFPSFPRWLWWGSLSTNHEVLYINEQCW